MKSSSVEYQRPRLIFLLLFVTGLFLLLHYLYSLSVVPAPIILGVSFVCSLFLVGLEGLYVLFSRIRARELPLVLALGIAGTAVSVFFATTLNAAGPCTVGVSGGGFPLPWYITFTQYTGPDRLPCPFFSDGTSYWQMFAIFSFLFDAIFYAGLAMARNEVSGWAKQFRSRV